MADAPFTPASFQVFLNQHQLMGSRCIDCGKVYLPPRAICPNCFSEHMEWVRMPEHARLLTYTAIYVPTSIMAQQGYSRENPHVAGIVELENGLRVSARITGVNPSEPSTLEIGESLVIDYLQTGSNESGCLLAFHPG